MTKHAEILKSEKSVSIITLIKNDHRPLKSAIRILKSDSASDWMRTKTLKRFLTDLRRHATSEEKSLYQTLIEREDVRRMILEGYEEHELADLLSAQLERSGYERFWSDEIAAKAKVLADLVEHHLAEEEDELLPALVHAFSAEELRALGRSYCSIYKSLEDSKDVSDRKQIFITKEKRA